MQEIVKQVDGEIVEPTTDLIEKFDPSTLPGVTLVLDASDGLIDEVDNTTRQLSTVWLNKASKIKDIN